MTSFQGAKELERQILLKCLLARRNDNAIRKMNLDLLRVLVPYMELTELEKNEIERLRNIKKPARIGAQSQLPQLTLGQLIRVLNTIPDKSIPVVFHGLDYNSSMQPHASRGNGSELALDYEKTDDIKQVNTLITELESVVETSLFGYKDNIFLMTLDTPLWIATYGESEGYCSSKEKYEYQAITGIRYAGYDNIIEMHSDICEP